MNTNQNQQIQQIADTVQAIQTSLAAHRMQQLHDAIQSLTTGQKLMENDLKQVLDRLEQVQQATSTAAD